MTGNRLGRTTTRVLCGALLLPTLVGGPWRDDAHAGGLPALDTRLPSRPLPCAVTGELSRPHASLLGRPGVLLFIDAEASRPSSLERFLAGMQEQFAPWLHWNAVLVGRAPRDVDALARLRGPGTLRVDHCWRDEDGSWAAACGFDRLPAALLHSDAGYAAARQVGLRVEEKAGLARAVERLAAAAAVRGRPVRDFKLEDCASGRPTTFADIPQSDLVLLLSVAPDCAPCAKALEVLRAVGRAHPERTTLAVVEHAGPGGAGEATAAAACELRLRDADGLFAERYALGGVPTLLAIDRAGEVVLARQGFTAADADALRHELESLLARPGAPSPREREFAEFLRVRAEGLALLAAGKTALAAFFLERALELSPGFYTLHLPLGEAYLAVGLVRDATQAYARYLAAAPLAGDRAAVLATLRSLTAAR